MSRKVPLYANLIKIGDNVHLASGVSFLTHDITHVMLNKIPNAPVSGRKYRERIGCIEIGDNVFVGSGTQIMYDVKIGPNVIIAAGSVITKDVPGNCVMGGIPAKRICSFDDYLERRGMLSWYPEDMKPKKQTVSDELAAWMWRDFDARRL